MKKIITTLILTVLSLYADTATKNIDMVKDQYVKEYKKLGLPYQIDEITIVQNVESVPNTNIIHYDHYINNEITRKSLEKLFKKKINDLVLKKVFKKMESGLKKKLITEDCKEGSLERELLEAGVVFDYIYRNDDGVFANFQTTIKDCNNLQ